MSTVHVVPLADPVEHTVPGGYGEHGWDYGEYTGWLAIEAVGEAEDCLCGPTIEHVPNEDGPDGWLVTHRELCDAA